MAQLFQEPSLQLTALQILCNFEDASLIQKKTKKQNHDNCIIAYHLYYIPALRFEASQIILKHDRCHRKIIFTILLHLSTVLFLIKPRLWPMKHYLPSLWLFCRLTNNVLKTQKVSQTTYCSVIQRNGSLNLLRERKLKKNSWLISSKLIFSAREIYFTR